MFPSPSLPVFYVLRQLEAYMEQFEWTWIYSSAWAWSSRQQCFLWGVVFVWFFQAKISLVVSWNYVFSCFKLVELFGKIKPPIINIDSGTKCFGATFVLKLISCSKIITVFNSWLNEKFFSCIYLWIVCQVLFYLQAF